MSRIRKSLRVAVLGLTLLFAVSPSLAQKKEQTEGPWDVSPMEEGYRWVPWVFAFLFAAGCLGMAFKNPHRTHLD